MRDKALKGFVYGIIASAAYGMNPVFAVPLYNAGMDPVSVLFFRYLLGVPAIWLLMYFRGRNVMLGREIIGRISLLGVLMVVSSLTLFFSYTLIDVGVASSILFVYPLLVALIMVMFCHEILSSITYLCLLGALGGVFLMCGPSDNVHASISGVALVLLSALSYAVYIVLVNHKPYKNIATLPLTFWVMVFGLIVLIGVICFRGRLEFPHTFGMWFNAIMLAIVPTVISFVFTNMAIETIGATSTAALGIFEPVTAVFFGVIMFGETLTMKSFIGLLLILGCTTLVITRRDITRRIPVIRTMFPKRTNRHERRSGHRHTRQ